jgi:hypothetical protein
MRSNICSNNIALYDSAMITSEIGMTTNIQLDITQSSYEKIKGGYYIYKIYLNELKLYTKIAEDISRLYTKPVDIASSYIILGGDVTGNVNAYMQVNGQNQTSIDFNTPQIVADVRYTTPSEPHDNAPGLIKLLAGADTGTYIRIKGPLGAMEKIGDSYICMLQLYEGGQISYPFDFHIGTENGTEFYPVGSYANLQAGIYKFIAKGVGEIESNVPYYIFIDHDYYYIAENPNNRFYSYPKYTYTIINDILYISSESLANVWGPTGYMAPLTAAQNLQVFIRSSVKNAVKFTIDLEKDAAISNLRLIETNNLSYVEDNQ